MKRKVDAMEYQITEIIIFTPMLKAILHFFYTLHTTHKVQPNVSLMFLPHFNIFSDLLTDPWKYRVYLFYILNKKKKNVSDDVV